MSSLLLLLAAAFLCASPHRPRLHAERDLTVVGIAADTKGYLWLATTTGLVRYDGLHFCRIPGSPQRSPRWVGVTRDDAVWIAGPEGLSRYDGSWRRVLTDYISSFLVQPDRLFVGGNDRPVLQISLEGNTIPTRMRLVLPAVPDKLGRYWQSSEGNALREYSVGSPGKTDGPVFHTSGSANYGVTDAYGRLWVSDEDRAILYQNDRPIETLQRKPASKVWRPAPLIRGIAEQVWFIGETIHGLSPPVVLEMATRDRHFVPTAGFQDQRGHLWVALQGLGLVEWVEDASWERWFEEDFHDQLPTAVVRTGHQILAGTNRSLHKLHDGKWTAIPSEPREYIALIEEREGSILASARKVGVARVSAGGSTRATFPCIKPSHVARGMIVTPRGDIHVGCTAGMMLLKSTGLVPSPLPWTDAKDRDTREFALDSQGRIWAAYSGGIAARDEGVGLWQRIPTSRPIEKIRSFALGGNRNGDDIWIAYRRKEYFSRLQRKGEIWEVTDYKDAGGNGPPVTHYFRRDSRGWIWRGTADGVFVSDGVNAGPADWIHLNRAAGLAVDLTADFGFFEDKDASVWIAGAEGVSHIRPNRAWFQVPDSVPPPRITRLVIDGVEHLEPGTHSPQKIRREVLAEVGSLYTPPFRDYPFRYRVAGQSSEWRYSRDGVLRFDQLPHGTHTLEVSYNTAGNSPTTRYTLQVHNPSVPWIPIAGSCAVLTTLWFAARRTTAYESIHYRLSKSNFLLRRRLGIDAQAEYSEPGVGDVVGGRFRIRSIISRGGFSVVYDAADLQTQQRVAVKISRGGTATDGRTRDRFALEIATLQSIQHPAIVPILHWWLTSDGAPCIAMPLLEGPTMRDLMSKECLRDKRIARLVQQFGSALSSLHQRGFVHRDLKPENVLVTNAGSESEQAVLIDFGAAGLRPADGRLAATTVIIGSFRYMAPERLTGKYSASSDVYSLAVMSLEMLTGKALDALDAAPSSDIFDSELTSLCGSEKLARCLSRCFDPNPKTRAADAAQWSEEFSGLLLNDPA